MIYLDNAATTLRKPEAVVRAVTQALTSLGNSARGAHEGALSASRLIYDTRSAVAELVGCPRPDHVIFCSGATEALNAAIFGLLRPGDRVLTTALEHNSVLRPLYHLQAQGTITLDILPADRQGNVDAAELVRRLPGVRLLAVTHASNLTGNLQDAAALGRLAHEHGSLFLLDACQSVGSIPVDMRAMCVDLLCFSAHKGLMGPQGVGCLCIRPGVELEPRKLGGTGVQTELRTQPRQYPVRLEAGTLNTPGIAGLRAALRCLREEGLAARHTRELALARRFYEGVRELPGVTVYGDFSGDRAAIVSLNIRDYGSTDVADELAREYDIAVRAGAHCAPLMHAALGTTEQGAVRFSFSCTNTEREADAAVEAVRRIAAC